MLRATVIGFLVSVALLSCTACAETNGDNGGQGTPQPLAEAVVTATPRPRTTVGQDGLNVSLEDPAQDCLAGTSSAACPAGRDVESVTFTVEDNTILLAVTTLGFDWENSENYLAYFLFDTDRDTSTGDIDFAEQYQLGPDVIMVLQPLDGTVALSLQTVAGLVPLASDILRVDGGTLTLAIPSRYLSTGDFEFVFFVLGADAVKDRFPDNARLHFPSGELLPNR